MTRIGLSILALGLIHGGVCSQSVFDRYFLDRTLRIDYFHVGNNNEEFMTVDHMYKQGPWAGTVRHLTDPVWNGRYGVRVYDVASNTLIYAKVFDSYFGEYKTTKPAKEGMKRTFHESVLVPFPRRPVLVVLEMRDRRNLYHPLLTFDVDPGDYHIIDEIPQRGDEIITSLKNGDPHEKVDIAIIGEGYTAAEREKFRNDLKRYSDILFTLEPYKSMKDRFNVHGILSPSQQSGVDEPRQHSYRKTLLGATFNSLDSDRYLLVEDNRLLRDIAAQVPYDIMMVMVNSKRYGGGGFNGYYCTFTSDGPWSDYVFHHEFGHTFGGLSDEYYTSDVAYDEFFPPGVEPSEPNLTALLDTVHVKWREYVSPGLAVPTPWGQETFDSLAAARDAMSKDTSAGADARRKEIGAKITQFMETHPLRGKVGAFGGGGFVPKGFYRPTVNSIMHQFNKSDRAFFKVNEEAISRVIRYYSE